MVPHMASYITSDAHGHLRALDQALEQAAPGADDTVYVLGDMIDRGPEPVGVINLVRSLPNVHVLMGNHERLMLNAIECGSQMDIFTWERNGGYTTSAQFDALPVAEYRAAIEWIRELPLSDAIEVGDRAYLLAHAGIEPRAFTCWLAGAGYTGEDGYADVPIDVLRQAMAAQDEEDLLWIREAFWGVPTGLVGPDGRGPVVIAGHTPSGLLFRYAANMCGTGCNKDGLGCMVEVGPTYDTGGVADHLAIDCSAAAGAGVGRVGVMRLNDRRVWYGDIAEGE